MIKMNQKGGAIAMLDSKILTFLKVAQLKNYTKAAEELHLTQPAVSQHIKKLEEYYGCKLIRVSGKSVGLTEGGKNLYHYANLQLANEYQLMGRLEGVARPLHIGATLSIADYYLPTHLIPYIAEQKHAFRVTVNNTENLISMLLNGNLDCAFIEGIFEKDLFQSRIFCETRFLPVARAGHPLAEKTATLPRFHEFPLALREQGSGTRDIMENYLYQQNDSIHSFPYLIEMNSFDMIKQFLIHSDAISFMYEEVAHKEVEQGELCYLSLHKYLIKRPLYFIYPKNSLSKERYEEFYRSLAFEKREFR